MDELLETLTRTRQAKDVLPIPPGVEQYWSKDPDVALRPYQIQMVWNLILCPTFLCGDSCGLGKCLAEGTLLWTASGLVRATSFKSKPGYTRLKTQVQTDRGADTASHIYDDGVRPTKKITLRNGFQIEGTLDHPLRVISGDGHYIWRKMKDLQVGDTIALLKKPFSLQVAPKILPSNPFGIDVMTPELALFLGMLIGNASWERYQIRFVSHTEDVENQVRFVTLARDLFGVNCFFASRDKRRPSLLQCNINRVALTSWLDAIDVQYDSQRLKYVPRTILEANPEIWKAFLSGLLATDGHITKAGRFELTMKSERLMREVQQIFFALGVHSKLSLKVVKPRIGNGGGSYWRLDLNGEGLNLLPDIFKYCPLQRKLARLKSSWSTQVQNYSRFCNYSPLKSRFERLFSISRSGYRLWYLRTRNKQLMPRSFEKYYTQTKKAGASRDIGFSQQDWQDLDDLKWIYDTILPVEITTIEDSVSHCYDLVVPKSHTFIANGVISHNTAMGSAAMAAVKSAHPDVKFLVYTTTSAQRQWCEEVEKFTTLKARMLADTMRGVKPKIARCTDFYNFVNGLDDADVLVMRYSTIVHDGEAQIEYLRHKAHPVCVIYDEAATFKSHETITNKYVRAISALCHWRYGLSATPIENHLTEIYNIFHGMGLDVLGTPEQFRYYYCVEEVQGYRTQRWGNKWKKVPIMATVGYKNLNELSERLIPYFWARSVVDVGEQLPQLNTNTIDIQMSPLQIEKTEAIWEGMYTIDHLDLDEEEVKMVSSKMTVLLLHQLVSLNPALLSDRSEDHLSAPTSPKEDALIELLNTTLAGSKTIVYTRFRRELERLKVLLPKETGRNVLYIHGGMDKDDRYLMIQKFQNDPNETLICINQAAFQAVNLQQAANLIALDLPWSWGGLLQLVGRMVRLKSPHAFCNLYILHIVDSIDSHVIGLLKNKKGIFERILSKNASLGVFDETDHEPLLEGASGFVSKLFDTLTLTRRQYKPSALKGLKGSRGVLTFE